MHDRGVKKKLAAKSKPRPKDFSQIALRVVERVSRIHQSLRVTPAMEAGITDHVWDIEEIVNLLE